MKLKILGKMWELVFVPRFYDKDKRGECDAPYISGKQIRIHKKLHGEEKMEVILHEMIHASGWHIDEYYAHNLARDMARALTRLGFGEIEQ